MENYLGEVRAYSYPSLVPKGWLMCDGRLLSMAKYPQLFSLLGTQFGGDGKSTFAIPDLIGKMPIGMGKTPDGKNYAAGQTAGNINVTLTAANLPAHSHALQGSATDGTTGSPVGNLFAQPKSPALLAYRPESPGVALVEMEAEMIAPTGSNQPFSKVQPVIGILFAIATIGLFPPRP